jgi:hypothetical protein
MNHKKPVHQFTLKGELIQSFASVNDAARSIDPNLTGGHISRVLNGHTYKKSAYGFLWSDSEKLTTTPGQTTGVWVVVTSAIGKVLRFKSIRAAARFLEVHQWTLTLVIKTGKMYNGYKIHRA